MDWEGKSSWDKMGVDPKSTTRLLKQEKDSDTLCVYCGRMLKQKDMINSDICIDCYANKRICPECGEKIIPIKNENLICPKCHKELN